MSDHAGRTVRHFEPGVGFCVCKYCVGLLEFQPEQASGSIDFQKYVPPVARSAGGEPPKSLTDFPLAAELMATATWVAAQSWGVGVHLERINRAADFLKGHRQGQNYNVRWLLFNDATCAAIAAYARQEVNAELESLRARVRSLEAENAALFSALADLTAAARNVIESQDRLEAAEGRIAASRASVPVPPVDPPVPPAQECVRVWPENYWREVWHDGCPKRGPMKRDRQNWITIEDGSTLIHYKCLGCGAECYAGLDAKRRIVSRPAALPKDETPAPETGR